jgi:hypothetical protein
MKKLLPLFLILLLCGFKSQASHLSGAFITYTHVSGNTYDIKLELLRDCTGVTFLGTENIAVSSASQGYSTIVTLDTTGAGGVTNAGVLCLTGQNTCTNPAAIAPGYEYWHYAGQVTLPSTANDWYFVYSNCCRPMNVNNLSSTSYTVYAFLDNSVAPNNGVQFQNAFNVLSGTGVNNITNLSSFETDGDSLHYSLTTPLDINISTNCLYNPGYSLANPFSTNGSITINAQTGVLNYTNSMIENDVIAVKVDEYRNGVLIGTCLKDIMLNFIPGGNITPTASGIGGGASFIYTYNVCPGGAGVNFNINSSDANTADSTRLEYIPNLTNAVFTTNTGVQNQTGTLTWTPTVADVSSTPYLFNVKVYDNACPMNGENTFTYLVYVNQCNTDSVWAGDANADFIVNNQDILALGLANGSTGSVRAGATTNWQAEYCLDWAQTFVSGINFKHADCNGNGTVDIVSDQAAVTTNYGQFHNKKDVEGKKLRGLPELYLDVTGVTFTPGTTVQLPIMLGNPGKPLSSFYGVASTLDATNAFAQTGMQINKIGNWIPAAELASFDKKITNARNEFAITKFNQTGTNGYGQIGTLTYTIAANAIPGSIVDFNFVNTKVINTLGDTIAIDVPDVFATIGAPLSVGNIAFTAVQVLPNPATNNLAIEVADGQTYTFTLTNAAGQILQLLQTNKNTNIDISAFARGLYFLNISDAKNNRFSSKLILQ